MKRIVRDRFLTPPEVEENRKTIAAVEKEFPPAPKPVHGEEIPFHVKHDLSATPPLPCDFKLGERVIFTNDAGGKWELTVRGFAHNIPLSGYSGFIYIFPDTSSWWFPVRPESLTHAPKGGAS